MSQNNQNDFDTSDINSGINDHDRNSFIDEEDTVEFEYCEYCLENDSPQDECVCDRCDSDYSERQSGRKQMGLSAL